MMEEEDGEDYSSTPFWVQSTNSRRHQGRRLRQGISSFFLSSGLLITLLLVTAVSFLVFVVPSTISFSKQIFRPNNVKKSWDSLNLVLVLFALVFGFLSRNRNEDRNFDDEAFNQTISEKARDETTAQKSNPSAPHGWYDNGYSIPSSVEGEGSNQSNPSNHYQWFGYSDRMGYSNNNRGGGLKRTSSSYPDLVEVEASSSATADPSPSPSPWVFYDDMHINTSRLSSDGGQVYRRRSWKYAFDDDTQIESKYLYQDAVLISPKQPPASPIPSPAPPAPDSPPPASPPLPPAEPPRQEQKEKPLMEYESVANKRERRRKRRDNQPKREEPVTELPVIPPAPPPPLPEFVDQNSGKRDKKRSGGNATKDFLNSLYHKKKKKQRQKSVENADALLHLPQTPPLQFQLPPRSPPPPPPPSVFQPLLSTKKSKRKTSETVISVPIPPQKPIARPKASSQTAARQKMPPQPKKVRSFDSEEGYSNSGGESPRIPIPPPPPPPPPFLKSPAWKFVLQGDFVRLDSTLSSRSRSPEPDEELDSDATPTAADVAETETLPFPASPLFFPPSPDVNTKADNFINRFRAGLELEKMNSMNKRGVGLSNLGPGSGPNRY